MEEIWRPIAGFDMLYEVSDQAQVRVTTTRRGTRKGWLLKSRPDSHGYLTVNLVQSNGKRRMRLLHRLVALTFIPNPVPRRNQVNHKDGVKAHCAASNLEWVTCSENHVHAYATGLRPRPLTDVQRAEIMAIGLAESEAVLAKRYGVSKRTIYNARHWIVGRLHKGDSHRLSGHDYLPKLTPQQRAEIASRRGKETQRVTAERYGVSSVTVSHIQRA